MSKKEFIIPEIIEKINKDKKATKLTTLGKAKAMKLKRFFSGSFFIDDMIGGGYAYRRIQLLFGAKSAGKNAQLQQMIAYNQRLCRKCLLEHGEQRIRPDYWDLDDTDRWIFVLKHYLRYPKCTCEEKFEPKTFVIFDYEKALSIEDPGFTIVKLIKNKENGAEVDELDYNDVLVRLESLELKEKLTQKDKEEIEQRKQWLENIEVTEQKIERKSITDYLIDCGIIIDELMVSDPADTEEGIEYAREIIKDGIIDGVIWDSLQASVPKYVEDRDADQATMGVEAKQNALMMRLITSAFSAKDLTFESQAYKTALFVTSQVRAKLGGFVSGPDTYSGGNAVQHHISLALELKRQHYLDGEGKELGFGKEYFGQRVRVRPDKNKLNAPGGMWEYNYYFKKGPNFPVGYIDHVYEIIELSTKYGVLEKSGSYYKFQGKTTQGIQNFANIIREDPKIVGDLYQQIKNNR